MGAVLRRCISRTNCLDPCDDLALNLLEGSRCVRHPIMRFGLRHLGPLSVELLVDDVAFGNRRPFEVSGADRAGVAANDITSSGLADGQKRGRITSNFVDGIQLLLEEDDVIPLNGVTHLGLLSVSRLCGVGGHPGRQPLGRAASAAQPSSLSEL